MRLIESTLSHRRLFLPLLLFSTAFTASFASAQNMYTWQPIVSGNWNVAGNWLDQNGTSGLPLSSATTTLNFGGTSEYTATNNIGTGSFTTNIINFSGSGAKTISSLSNLNNITLGGVGASINVADGTGAITLSSGLVFSSNSTTISNGTAGGGHTNNFTLADTVNYSGTNVNLNFANYSSGSFNIGNMAGVMPHVVQIDGLLSVSKLCVSRVAI